MTTTLISVGILVFPNVEELDFIGPFEVLSYVNKIRPTSTKVRLVAETQGPIQAFNGLKFIPDYTLSTCPPLDVLIIPGGKGRQAAMHKPTIIKFVMQQAQQVTYLASVCTGAFLLAEAGLLDGRKATTYHAALSELAQYNNVTVTKGKVIHDGNVITAAGVSSGLELGFYLLKLWFGSDIAQEVAAKIEYAIDIDAY